MRYQYAVVRYVPDTARGEYVNVGAVVVSPETGEGGVRQVENPARARRLAGGVRLKSVWAYLDYLSGLVEQHVGGDPSWLNRAYSDANNVVQLSSPAPISAESAEAALDAVFDLFIVDPERRNRAITKWAAYSNMRTAYLMERLAVGENLFERVTARSGGQEAHFDFAVGNGHLVQMTSAWSFQSQEPDEVSEAVKAWGYTVRLLQGQGGEVVTKQGERQYKVPKDIDLGAVLVPPRDPAGTKAYDQALHVFDDLGVVPKRYTEVSELAARAARAVQAVEH